MNDSGPDKKSPDKLAFTRKEAAEKLSVSVVTVDRLDKRGLLRSSRATRRPLYSLAELERFLRETTSDLV